MVKTFSVSPDYENMRIDRWIRKNFNGFTQGYIEKLLRKGKIKINKKKVRSSFKIKTNDIIQFYKIIAHEKKLSYNYIPSKTTIKDNEKSIIFNNDDYIVINKNADIAVQGGTKSKKNLIDIYSKSKFFKDSKPFTVHRIDKSTSGVLIIAKNRRTAQFFTSLFRLRKIHKTYIAFCYGEFKNKNGKWVHVLERFEKNKYIKEKAITNYKVLDSNSKYSLVEMKPITGRKHQLRKQAFIEGHPILGDDKYSDFKKDKKKLMLHSYSLKFMIDNKKVTHKADLPFYFEEFINKKKFKFLGS